MVTKWYIEFLPNCLISARYAGPIDCPLQTYAPEGEPLHSIVEEFADDQNAWLRDFLPVLEKITYLSDHYWLPFQPFLMHV